MRLSISYSSVEHNLMSEFRGLRLSPYYLNSRRLQALTGVELPLAAQTSLSRNTVARVGGMRDVSRLAERLLQSGQIPNLTSEAASRDLTGHSQLIAFVWGVFTFRGAPNAIRCEQEGKAYKNATFSGRIPIGDTNYELKGEIFNEHFYSVSSPGMLSGKRRMLVAGQFHFSGNRVEVFPYLICDLIQDMGSLPLPWATSIRVYPDSIDAFRAIAGKAPTRADLQTVLNMAEENVKTAFSEIIGEPFVPKDWGGERSDLITSRLTVHDQPTSAAFIFKGPSVPGTLHPKNMGKRGDQLIRAFDEPVDLVVVQHCNQIANSVVRMTEALAYDLRRPRRYCIIDGNDTALILKAHGKLPTN